MHVVIIFLLLLVFICCYSSAEISSDCMFTCRELLVIGCSISLTKQVIVNSWVHLHTMKLSHMNNITIDDLRFVSGSDHGLNGIDCIQFFFII